MGDKPAIPKLKPFLKRSTNITGISPSTKNKVKFKYALQSTPNYFKLYKNHANKNTQSTSLNASPPAQPIENLTQKSFAETTANFSFPKKDQAIIFNTIDGIPQIEYIKALSILTNPSNIKFASRVSNNRFYVYFSSKNIADDIFNQYLSINIVIRKLINPSKKIIISNVSPITPHYHIFFFF